MSMRIRLNGKEREIDAGHTVRTLLRELELEPGMIVVELNRDILERDSYEDVPVMPLRRSTVHSSSAATSSARA
jgi:thiamine biosynthesis protein ThiS